MVVPLASRHARVHLVVPRGPRVQRLGRRQRRYARGFDPSGEGVLHRHARRRPAIQFRDAAEFFGAEAHRAARDSGAISAAVCGRVGMGATPQRLPTGEVLGGRLLHIGRDTKWGLALQQPFLHGPGPVADGWTPDQLKAEFSDDFGRALLMHCYNEFTFLSRFLPGIYTGDNRDAAGDAALVSAAPQATDTRRIPGPPGHGVPRTVDPKQGLEYAVAKAAHHGQRPHRPEAVGLCLQPELCLALYFSQTRALRNMRIQGLERAAGVGLAHFSGPRTS